MSLENQLNDSTVAAPFAVEGANSTIVHRFHDQLQQCANGLAVKHGAVSWTYEDLAARAGGIALRLLEVRGAGSEPVALLGGTSPELIASILGVLLAGKFWIPLDPYHPPSRWSQIAQDAGVKCLVATSECLPKADLRIADTVDVGRKLPRPDTTLWRKPFLPAPTDLSHILYTSGSTGRPKGVMHSHRNSLHFIKAQTNALGLRSDDRFSLLAAHTHIAYVTSVLRALMNGGSIHIYDVKRDGIDDLPQWLADERTTVFQSVPTLFRHLVAATPQGLRFPALRLVHLGGEPVSVSDVGLFRRAFEPGCRLLHNYGSSEASAICGHLVDHTTPLTGNLVPIGRPWPDKEVTLEPVAGDNADGLVGEIVVKSRYLSLGYWNQPGQTAATFAVDPVDPEVRTMRTGDLAQRLPDGTLVHLGRKDDQVKLRGHRIHPAEIEMAILRFTEVRHAAVVLRDDVHVEPVLIAFLEPCEPAQFKGERLREFLQDCLPLVMIPADYVVLERMPLTSGGKIDRANLRKMSVAVRRRPGKTPPRTDEERWIAEIWMSLLSLDEVGVDDSILEVGGNSLQAMRLAARLSDEFGVPMNMVHVLKHPTIALQAAWISETLRTEPQLRD